MAQAGLSKLGSGTSIVWAILLIAFGFLAIALPFATSWGGVVVIAWLIVFSGGFQFIHAFQSKGIGSIVWKLLVAVLYLIVGLYFLLKPSPHGVQPGLGFFAGATPGTPLCRRPVAGLLLEDRDGTGGGGYSRASSGLQAPVTYHHRSF